MFIKDTTLIAIAAVGEDVAGKITFTYPTGSNYTCDPPVTNTDIDFFAYMPKVAVATAGCSDSVFWDEINRIMREDGWTECGDEGMRQEYALQEGYSDQWQAYRKGRFNVLITHDYDWFVQGAAASELCKALNLMDKDDRCSVHESTHGSMEGYIKAPTNLIAQQFVSSMQAHNWWNPPASSINGVGAPIHPPASPVNVVQTAAVPVPPIPRPPGLGERAAQMTGLDLTNAYTVAQMRAELNRWRGPYPEDIAF